MDELDLIRRFSGAPAVDFRQGASSPAARRCHTGPPASRLRTDRCCSSGRCSAPGLRPRVVHRATAVGRSSSPRDSRRSRTRDSNRALGSTCTGPRPSPSPRPIRCWTGKSSGCGGTRHRSVAAGRPVGRASFRRPVRDVPEPRRRANRVSARCDGPALCGEEETTRFHPGQGPLVAPDKFPIDPGELLTALTDGSIAPDGLSDGGAFAVVGDLLAQGNLPATTRAALLDAAAHLNGVRLLGSDEDPLGRPGESFAAQGSNVETRLLLIRTRESLARETYLPTAEGVMQLASWEAYLAVEWSRGYPPGLLSSAVRVSMEVFDEGSVNPSSDPPGGWAAVGTPRARHVAAARGRRLRTQPGPGGSCTYGHCVQEPAGSTSFLPQRPTRVHVGPLRPHPGSRREQRIAVEAKNYERAIPMGGCDWEGRR